MALNLAHVCHAVLLEKCLPDSFELKNSYPTDPIITIPKNQKTFYQNHIRKNIKQFDNQLSEACAVKIFAKYALENIEWECKNQWILSDEGYSLQFRLI